MAGGETTFTIWLAPRGYVRFPARRVFIPLEADTPLVKELLHEAGAAGEAGAASQLQLAASTIFGVVRPRLQGRAGTPS